MTHRHAALAAVAVAAFLIAGGVTVAFVGTGSGVAVSKTVPSVPVSARPTW